MAMSGVECEDAVVNAFNDQKLRRTHKYIKYSIHDKKTIKILESGDSDWNDFVASLPKDECVYATYDFAYKDGDGDKNKLVFLAWCPDESPVRNKMLYATSKDAIQKKLEGLGVNYQANSYADLAYSDILEKVSKSKA